MSVRPGGKYIRTEGDSIGTLRLGECEPPPQNEAGDAVAVANRPTTAHNGVGDAVVIPANAVPAGTHVRIVRPRGRPYRWVVGEAGSGRPAATLTIDLRGCANTAGATVVFWDGGHWRDVGGRVEGTAIIVELDHLSIYAVAGT